MGVYNLKFTGKQIDNILSNNLSGGGNSSNCIVFNPWIPDAAFNDYAFPSSMDKYNNLYLDGLYDFIYNKLSDVNLQIKIGNQHKWFLCIGIDYDKEDDTYFIKLYFPQNMIVKIYANDKLEFIDTSN